MNKNNPIWYPYTQMALASEPVKIVRGEGIWLFEENGNRLLDGISSWWVNIHGHSRIEIAEAIYQQSLQLEQVIFAGFTHEPALRLADTLLDSLNLPDWKVFYSDNGSTAVEVGLKMAIQLQENRETKFSAGKIAFMARLLVQCQYQINLFLMMPSVNFYLQQKKFQSLKLQTLEFLNKN